MAPTGTHTRTPDITPRSRIRYVRDFHEGHAGMKDLLGGKGANLAEMTRLGLPVPPGFTITTEACRYYLTQGGVPPGLFTELAAHLRCLERDTGKALGSGPCPLLVSVRSGSKFSMPGMMETILDIGLNDQSVLALAEACADEHFAWDSYRRLIQMYGSTVVGLPGTVFRKVLAEAVERRRVPSERELPVGELRAVVKEFQDIILRSTGRPFPQSAWEQLTDAVTAVFRSWNTLRAATYRHHEHIPDDLGTAVTVMAMVYGNLGDDSGTGVAFTRDPATGAVGVYGDYLRGAQGEDVVAGGHDTVPLADLEGIDPASFRELRHHLSELETHYQDLCDVEFTVEHGKLWMLQTRVGKRTAAAAFVIANDLVREGVIGRDEALSRVNGAQLAQLMFPSIATRPGQPVLATGVPASPGAGVGAIVLDSTAAQHATVAVVLVRPETTPDDLPGMIAAQAVLTSRGGKTSHAAVVARGMGKPCVCGTDSMIIDEEAGTVRFGDTVLNAGDIISVDGASGHIYRGQAVVEPSVLSRHLDGEVPSQDPVAVAADALLAHADAVRRMAVLANADTAEDAARALRLGATGIGLCRTEHMFLGERRPLIERLVLSSSDADREAVLEELLQLQRHDFLDMLRVMDGRPVTIRLLDPPLHEFLPSLEGLVERVSTALAQQRIDAQAAHDRDLLIVVRRMHEQNPMLGLRGVRLGLVIPGLMQMQARAIAQACSELLAAGLSPQPEIMIPLVADVRELRRARRLVKETLAGVPGAPDIPVGTMIETPRAALTSSVLVPEADFFSFGTNDLTQMTWGFSRDDVEAAFFPFYLEHEILDDSPFECLDTVGVGRLIGISVEESRAVQADLPIGVCGEHAADPRSVHFLHRCGVSYLSCSPYRIPVARLEAGRAELLHPADGSMSPA